MKIIDLDEHHRALYFCCLEDWSEELKEAGDHKAAWYEQMKDNGLRVKLALDDRGEVGGMIQLLPIEHSLAEGEGLYFINCIWIHGHKQGRGNFQKHGMGSALLSAAEADVKALGAKGIAAWGLWLPFFMRASWFKKHGYRKTDRDGLGVLLWKPFTPDAQPPSWIKLKKIPQPVPGQVTVTFFLNGWCPAMNMVAERAKRAAAEFGKHVVFRQVNTLDKNVIREWGIYDAMFVDDKAVRLGPPPSYEKIRKIIAGKVAKL